MYYSICGLKMENKKDPPGFKPEGDRQLLEESQRRQGQAAPKHEERW